MCHVAYSLEHGNPVDVRALAQIGSAMRTARRRLAWSQRRLAWRCGVSQSTISRLEAGKAPTTHLVRLARILIALDAELFINLRPPRLPPVN
jgi:transcriptional regulator with XRE-family HTH domain